MNRCPNPRVLRQLAEELLASPENETISLHLEGCPKCRSLLDEMSLFDEAPQYPDIPGFRILSELGRGGMGIVYLTQPDNGSQAMALKLMRPEFYGDSKSRQRFTQEIATLMRFQHPGIVRILASGEFENAPYYTMELVPGGSLSELLKGRPQPPAFTLQTVLELARTLVCIHEQGLVHRDLKPGNILLQREEQGDNSGSAINDFATPTREYQPNASVYRTKISDFGLVKALDPDGRLTSTGNMLGTPDYMSPEQLDGRSGAVGPAADIWALGVILYEMLTGRPPFRGATLLETIDQVRVQEPAPPHLLAPGTPRSLEIVCLSCLQKNPAARYASAAELAADLERCQAGMPVRAKLPSALARGRRWARRNPGLAGALAGAASLLVVVAALSVLYAWRADRDRLRIWQAQQESLLRQKKAVAARQRARQAFEQLTAPQITDLLARQKATSLTLAQKTWLEEVLKQQRAFAEEEPNDSETALWASEAAYRIGEIQRFLGRQAEALKAYEQAASGFRAVASTEGDSEQSLWGIGRTQLALGIIYTLNSQYDLGRAPLEEAESALASLSARDSNNHAYALSLFLARIELALLLDRSRLVEARDQVLSKALGMLDTVPVDQTVTADLLTIAAMLTTQATFWQVKRDWAKSLEAGQKARRFWLKLLELEPAKPVYRYGLAGIDALIGSANDQLQKLSEALSYFRLSCEGLAALSVEFPGVPDYASMEAVTRHQEAVVAEKLNDEAAATRAYERGASLWQTLLERHPGTLSYGGNLWETRENQGLFLLRIGRLGAALDSLHSALAATNTLALMHAPASDLREKRGYTHYNLACAHARRLGTLVGPQPETGGDRARAFEHLHQARDQKFFESTEKKKNFHEDRDLDTLRKDAGFQEFLATLEQR